MTGHESPEACFWCGKPTKNRYCSKECKKQYWDHFFWKSAREACLARASDRCQKCGGEAQAWRNSEWGVSDGESNVDGISGDITQKETMLEVHHIIPTLGEKRDWNRKNVPENIICLCKKCHALV